MGTLAVIVSGLLLLGLATAAMLWALWQSLRLAYYFSAWLQQLCCWHSGSHCVWLTTSRPGYSSYAVGTDNHKVWLTTSWPSYSNCIVSTLAVIVSGLILLGPATAAVLLALWQSLCQAYCFSAWLQQPCCRHSGRN